MEFEEGQVFEGTLGLGDEKTHCGRWIVVAPGGKAHLHSIDEEDTVHCWPLYPALKGLEDGTVRPAGREPDRPVLLLQRAKAAIGIEDTHLALTPEALERMLDLLERAVETGAPYAAQAGAEIRTFLHRGLFSSQRRSSVEERVDRLLGRH